MIKEAGVSNPVYDDHGEFTMGDLDTEMFPDHSFDMSGVTSSGDPSKSGATSMVNPLYQDPYMEDDDSPLSNF